MIQQLLLLYKRFDTGFNYETSIDELAAIWNCSPRYAKTIVRKCSEEGWIDWITYRGRGKKPKIEIHLTKTESIIVLLEETWKKGHYNKAFQLLQDHELISSPEIIQWVADKYGVFKTQDEQDIFRVPSYKTALRLDPVKLLSRHDTHLANQLHETLFSYCIDTQQAKPNLVFAYQTDDYKTWQFTLRKDVEFHNGKRLMSRDVIASLKRALKNTGKMWEIRQLSELNQYSFEIELERPNSFLPRLLSGNKTAIISREWIDDDNRIPIGCGAFHITNYSEELIELSTFPNYFKERPWIDRVEIVHTPEPLKFGISTKPFNKSIPSIEKTYIEKGADYIILNATSASPLQDEQLRQSLYALINPIDYCLTEEGEFEAHSFLPDSEKRKVLWNKKTPGKLFPKLKIGVQQIRDNANHMREARILSDCLTDYGIDHEIQLCPFLYTPQDINTNYDIFVGGLALGKDEILSQLLFYGSKVFPLTGFASSCTNQQIDQLLLRIITCDETKIMSLFEEIEQTLQDSATIKFLSHRVHKLYIREDSPFAGVEMDDNGKVDYKSIYRV